MSRFADAHVVFLPENFLPREKKTSSTGTRYKRVGNLAVNPELFFVARIAVNTLVLDSRLADEIWFLFVGSVQICVSTLERMPKPINSVVGTPRNTFSFIDPFKCARFYTILT